MCRPRSAIAYRVARATPTKYPASVPQIVTDFYSAHLPTGKATKREDSLSPLTMLISRIMTFMQCFGGTTRKNERAREGICLTCFAIAISHSAQRDKMQRLIDSIVGESMTL
jgi:hypothetical protein